MNFFTKEFEYHREFMIARPVNVNDMIAGFVLLFSLPVRMPPTDDFFSLNLLNLHTILQSIQTLANYSYYNTSRYSRQPYGFSQILIGKLYLSKQT